MRACMSAKLQVVPVVSLHVGLQTLPGRCALLCSQVFARMMCVGSVLGMKCANGLRGPGGGDGAGNGEEERGLTIQVESVVQQPQKPVDRPTSSSGALQAASAWGAGDRCPGWSAPGTPDGEGNIPRVEWQSTRAE